MSFNAAVLVPLEGATAPVAFPTRQTISRVQCVHKLHISRETRVKHKKETSHNLKVSYELVWTLDAVFITLRHSLKRR